MADDDERVEELSSITAIYPELAIDAYNPFAASIHLPVTPSTPLTISFQPAPLHSPPDSEGEDGKHTTTSVALPASTDGHKLDHLPPLQLHLLLPQGYPAELPPKVTLSTDPAWLPSETLRQLTDEAEKLWEEYGRMQVLFAYIDHLQQAAERAFDLHDTGLQLSPALKPKLLEFDARTTKEIFEAQTFDCGICLEPKKGSQCYRLTRCGHVFCRDCLQESYRQYITEGDVVFIRCLDPSCGKDSRQTKTKKDYTLHPRELLDMGLQEPTVRRYVEMKRKKLLESDKNTVYCPRSWCQAPARSTKYPPIPADLRDYPDSESSDDEDESQPANTGPDGIKEKRAVETTADRLRICSKCTLAFCRVCYSGWHGDFARCWPRNASELTVEEQASYDYIRMHTSPCPTCSSPTQKTMGCNHMICAQCQTHFCYLCGSWLDGSNPYQHFNRTGTECYQKLWELEEGDEGQGAGFAGARMWEQEARRVAEEADRDEAERLQNEENERAVLMDDDPININEEHPLRLNGGQLLPEAPAPPPGQLDPALAAQFAALQIPGQQDAQQPPARGRGRGGRGGWHLRGGRGRGNLDLRGAQRANARGRGRGGAGLGRDPARAPVHVPAFVPAVEEPAPEDNADAIRRFVELAQRDQEEEWDSDDLDDDHQWEIRPRNERTH